MIWNFGIFMLMKTSLFGCRDHVTYTSVRASYLFGEDVLQREAKCSGQSTNKSRDVKGELGHCGQQHATDDGDE